MSKQEFIKKVDQLLKSIELLVFRIDSLERENRALREELARSKTKKNSKNSHMPPSSDIPKTSSRRKSSGKKPGGQPGRKGNTLKMVETPDIIKDHQSNYCIRCGNDLSLVTPELVGKRQVIDIPPVKPIVTEHRVYKRVCTCGHCNQGAFPEGVKTPVSYGSGVQSLIAYLNTRHYVAVARCAEFMKDIFQLPISTGGVCHLLKKAGEKAIPVYDSIRRFVLDNTVIGADETGVNINGKNHWVWTFQNPRATYIAVHESRGSKAIDHIMPEGFDNNILVTDCWASYFKKGAMSHQLCTAHLQRELEYLVQRFPENTWAKRVDALIDNAVAMSKKENLMQLKVDEIHRSFDLLLKEPASNKNIKELLSFQKRLVKYQDYVFGFLDNPEIPPDNNGSERAIRNFKVKLNVSGFFKSFDGSEIYSVLRSVIDTALKNDKNPYLALKALANC